ncbi:MAG TPA: hypothetical protein VG603_13230 [Chitinophagales bacterium]|nr:hypothetical protein [Chitinophagales bacterium]
MLVVGIILCYLLGLSLLLLISRKNTLAEMVGYSFLLGMGVETLLLFLLDIINLRYSAGLLTGLNVFGIIIINGLNYKNLLALKNEYKAPAFELKQLNLVATALFVFMAYLFYGITVKNLFWPASAHDAIGSFDKLGKVMAIEGKLKISLFDYKLEGAGGVYPPLFHASLAYVYIFGAETGKIVTSLFFLSLLTSFYSVLRVYVDATAAALFTLLLMISPELMSHAALSLDNLPTTAYVGPGALATFAWLDKRDRKYFWLGAILTGFAVWIRSDTVVFTAAALLVIGIDFLRSRNLKDAIIYAAIIVAPFIVWALYLKFKIHFADAAKFDFSIGYNTGRMDMMMGYISAYLFGGHYRGVDGGQLYGITFILFFVMILANLGLIYRFGARYILLDKMYVLVFFFAAFVLYFVVFYFINEQVQNAPLYSLMESSFKRGLFCFIPIVLFYSCTNYASSMVFEKIEKFRSAL